MARRVFFNLVFSHQDAQKRRVGLSAVFLAHVRGDRDRFDVVPDLEPVLENLVTSARRAWPALGVSAESFLAYLAERLPADENALQALAAVHASDLFLACACTQGNPRALTAFDKHFVSALFIYLARADAFAAFGDEVKQLLRTRLLVAEKGLLPSITSYSGRGPLAAWLRMTAARIAVDLRRAERNHQPIDGSQHHEVRAASPDPELQYIKTRYREDFEKVFTSTLSSLRPAPFECVKNSRRIRLYPQTFQQKLGTRYKE